LGPKTPTDDANSFCGHKLFHVRRRVNPPPKPGSETSFSAINVSPDARDIGCPASNVGVPAGAAPPGDDDPPLPDALQGHSGDGEHAAVYAAIRYEYGPCPSPRIKYPNGIGSGKYQIVPVMHGFVF